jgi:hypothetical protein
MSVVGLALKELRYAKHLAIRPNEWFPRSHGPPEPRNSAI